MNIIDAISNTLTVALSTTDRAINAIDHTLRIVEDVSIIGSNASGLERKRSAHRLTIATMAFEAELASLAKPAGKASKKS